MNSLLIPVLAQGNPRFIDGHNFHLLIVFGFVLAIVAIGAMRRIQQQKMWHETVRLAIEKGQPIPSTLGPWGPFGRGWRYGGNWPLVRGIVLIGIGVGMRLVENDTARQWAPLPICIGAALVVLGFINLLRAPKDPGFHDPSAQK